MKKKLMKKNVESKVKWKKKIIVKKISTSRKINHILSGVINFFEMFLTFIKINIIIFNEFLILIEVNYILAWLSQL